MKLSVSKPKTKVSFEISKGSNCTLQSPARSPLHSPRSIPKSPNSKHGFYSEFEIIKPVQTVSTMSLHSLKPGPDETYSDKYKETMKSCCTTNCLSNFLPILLWLPHYEILWLKPDIMAGITVSILQVPQVLAYAQLAGLPPEWGLYASVIPVLLYAIWSTSTKVAVGPGAPSAIMLASAVNGVIDVLGKEYNDELYQEIAMTFTFCCGVVFLTLGLMRAGFVTVFVSRPVMTGFIMSASFIIILSQCRGLFGLDIARYPLFYETLIAVINNIHNIHWWTTLISMASLFLLFLPKFITKIPKLLPMPLIVMVINILLSYFLDFKGLGVATIGADIKSGFPMPKIPNFKYFGDVFPSALIITVVDYMSNIMLAKGFEQKMIDEYQQQIAKYNNYIKNKQEEDEETAAIHKKNKDNDNNINNNNNNNDDMITKPIKKPLDLAPLAVNANMEFFAYGIANLFGSWFSSQLISASFSRTALNAEMSGHTRIAGFVRIIICLLCLLFLMPFLSPLPKCVLASVVCTAVYRLIKSGITEFKFLYHVSKFELIEFCVSVIAPLVIGMEMGIFLSIGTSIVVNLLRHTFASIIFLGRLESTVSRDDDENDTENVEYVDCELFKEAKYIPYIKIIEIKAGLSFSNNIRLVDKLRELLADGNRFIVVSLNLTSFIDTTAIRQIVTIFEDAKTSYICFSQCKPKVVELIRRYQKNTDKFPENVKTFVSTHDAVKYLQSLQVKEGNFQINIDYYSSGEEEDILSKQSMNNTTNNNINYYITPQIDNIESPKNTLPQFTRI